MLSRVADSLYWMSRYLERAEHTARVLDVNLHGRLDQRANAAGQQWARVLQSLSIWLPEAALQDTRHMVERLTIDRSEPNSVVSCIIAARQNAREIREQISTEMWEQLNRLYLHVLRTQRNVLDGQTYDFFQVIKQGCHLFEGITSTTMSREEGYYFIRLARYLERVAATVNLLDVHVSVAHLSRNAVVSGDQYLEWVGLLKSCAALEAYWREHTANIIPEKGAAFLLLDPAFPHSVRFGAEMIRSSLDALSGEIPSLKRSDVHRRVGKMLSALSFNPIEEIVGRDVHTFLSEIRTGCMDVHNAVYQACITYPIDLAVTA